jgi:RNA polymerase sigma-70 factor (ECF subfamily)
VREIRVQPEHLQHLGPNFAKFESQAVVPGRSIGPTLTDRRASRRRFIARVASQLSDAVSERPQSGDYLAMRDRTASVETPRRDATVIEAADETRWYDNAIADFGSTLARLAAAYEFDRAQQQDLLQEIHLALWRSFAGFRDQCSLRTWVYRVAHNTAATYVRRQKRSGVSRLVSLEELDDLPGQSDAERSLDESAVLARLSSLIQRLKPLDRDVMLLYLEGTSAAAIGEVTGLSPANVAQKIHRTKKVLQRHF